MIPLLIGVGGAGCRIGDLLLTRGSAKAPFSGLLLDSESSDLQFATHRKKLLLGEKVVEGHGTGGSVEVGREILEMEKSHILKEVDALKGRRDCFFVISAMGGGTGGAVAALLEELKKGYSEPVYYAGILPTEEDSERVAVNFSETFKGLLGQCDAVFPIDNDLLKEKGRLTASYNKINERVARSFRNLFEIGEYRSREELGENVVNVSEVFNTLAGVSTIGYEAVSLKSGPLGFLMKKEEENKPEMVVNLTKEAMAKTLLPINSKDSTRGLVVVSGPRKFLGSVGSIPARLWMASNIGGIEVRGGDMPSEGEELGVTVILSGVKRSDRIKYLYQLGQLFKSKSTHAEKVSRIFDKAKVLNAKLLELQEEFRGMYEEMKEMVAEPQEKDKEPI